MALSKKKPYGLMNPYDLNATDPQQLKFVERPYSLRQSSIASPADMNLDMSMPPRDVAGTVAAPNGTVTEANTDVKKPAGVLSRIKNFVTDQVGQFADEQMGTEEPGSSSGMGRVLRALAGAGTVAAIGGQPAVQLATGVAGAVRNLAGNKERLRLENAKLLRDEEDRSLKNQNIKSQMTTREQEVNDKRTKGFMDSIRSIGSSGLDFLGLSPSSQERAMRIKNMQSMIDERGKPDKLKDPKEEKPMEMPGKSYHIVDGKPVLNEDKFNSDLSTRIVSKVKARLLNEKVKDATGKEITKWEAASTPGTTRQVAKAMIETDPEFRQMLLDEDQIKDFAEEVTQLRHKGAMTPQQYKESTADQITVGPGFTGKLADTITSLAEDFNARRPRMRGPDPKNWKF